MLTYTCYPDYQSYIMKQLIYNLGIKNLRFFNVKIYFSQANPKAPIQFMNFKNSVSKFSRNNLIVSALFFFFLHSIFQKLMNVTVTRVKMAPRVWMK